ncbi:hypothetical protein PPERSA_13128 [Pseudocohnilembus persalinus]|uniref:Uncharacterized protein n=1 Tax=Pseudocohnilembus persalinus TaxID=266149 RepID=A0A0V0QW77_PSEPJ|nr:hypothetical protein PPERSA_13128 [Pseudocohnilembus persalinus]|eukprot:KRX06649.1 hypothetical protein PPERSA_13128 [Pseudocohnilembus persalinus]
MNGMFGQMDYIIDKKNLSKDCNSQQIDESQIQRVKTENDKSLISDQEQNFQKIQKINVAELVRNSDKNNVDFYGFKVQNQFMQKKYSLRTTEQRDLSQDYDIFKEKQNSSSREKFYEQLKGKQFLDAKNTNGINEQKINQILVILKEGGKEKQKREKENFFS